MENTLSKSIWNKYLTVVNLDFLFNFRSILFTLIRQVNERQPLQMSLKNSSLKSFQFSNIDQFTNYFARDNLNLKEVINNKIITSELFKTTKPMLMPSIQFFYFNFLMKSVKSYDLLLYTQEEFFLKFLTRENVSLLTNVFQIGGNLKIMTASQVKKTLQQISDSTLVIAFENQAGTLLNDTSLVKSSACEFLIYGGSSTFKPLMSSSSSIKIFRDYEEFLTYFSREHFQDKDMNIEQYKSLINQQFCEKYKKELLISKSQNYFLLPLWSNYIQFQSDRKVRGVVVKGFQRGSRMLGVPTANIDIHSNSEVIDDLINGVYYGTFQFALNPEKIYRCVLSIGYNPFFDNDKKTIEVFLIDYDGEDFYGECAIIAIKGQIRSEAAFDGISELVTAITYDIITANQILRLE